MLRVWLVSSGSVAVRYETLNAFFILGSRVGMGVAIAEVVMRAIPTRVERIEVVFILRTGNDWFDLNERLRGRQ